MASKLVKDISQDFLDCCICMKQFKTPKMLPCIHSFCEGCLEKYVIKHGGNEIPCPTCRKICKLPETGVKGLQTNFHLINLAEKVNLLDKLTSAKKKTQVCDSCKSGEIVAYCVDCNFAICSKCQDHHAMFPILRSHSVIPINKLTDPKFQQEWKNAKSPYCGLHSSEKLHFYCKTCSQLICRDCTIVLHCKPEHDCTEAVSQFNNSKENLNKLLESSNDQLEKGLEFIKEGVEGFKAINTAKNRIGSESAKHCDEGVSKMKLQYKQQKQKLLEEITEFKSKPVETQVNSAKNWVKRMKSTQDMTEHVIKENNPWDLLGMFTELTNAFGNLQNEIGVFKWDKDQLRHDIEFAPNEVPNVQLGTYRYPADVVVSDSQGNFILCYLDRSKKIFSIQKINKPGSNFKTTETHLPYNWPYAIPSDAKIVVTAEVPGYLFVGIGNYVMKLNFELTAMNTYTLPAGRLIQCLGYRSDQSYLYIADNNHQIESLNMTLGKCGGTIPVTATSPIEFILPSQYNLLFFTKNDCLKTYYWAGYGYDTHKIDPPEETLHCTATVRCLRGLRFCNFFVNPAGRNTDQYSVFLMWTWNKVSKTTDKQINETWIIKEYCTKERKVLGVLEPQDEHTHKYPTALFNAKTADDGVEVHLCDNVGTVTTYKRGVYKQAPERYTKA